jgi:hypothetical protein
MGELSVRPFRSPDALRIIDIARQGGLALDHIQEHGERAGRRNFT